MNVIFLDFDGPIITARSRAAGLLTDPVAVRAIRNALEDATARLVVSSSHRLNGKEHCVNVLDQVDGCKLSGYLHHDWSIEGHENYPAANTRGEAIRRWMNEHGVEWEQGLIIDDYPIQRYHPLAVQVYCEVTQGMNHVSLSRLAEWAADRRAAR